MPSKRSLRKRVAYWLAERNRFADELTNEKAAHSITQSNLRMAEVDRDKYLRQLQSARSACEDLRRALYPGLHSTPLTPSIAPFGGGSIGGSIPAMGPAWLQALNRG